MSPSQVYRSAAGASLLTASLLTTSLLTQSCKLRETDATATAAIAAPAPNQVTSDKAREGTRLSAYPNGGVLVADVGKCSVMRVHETQRWTRSVAPCGGTLEVAVALDSTAIVRTATVLAGFDPEGTEVWKVTLPATGPAEFAAPAVTRDSMAVVAASPQLVVAYRKGQEVWRSVLPASEALVAAPMGSQTEGVLVASAAGVTALGADGSVRWTTNPAGRKPQ